MKTIGFIGLGHMGLPMAHNLHQAGFRVLGFDLDTVAKKAWQEKGGILAPDLETLAKEATVIITMLQTHLQVEDVLAKEQGLFYKASPETLFIDCSTIDINASLQLEKKAQTLGLSMIDAPVSGGVKGAGAKTLTFMVGASRPLFERAKPILEAMGSHILHAGARGAGVGAKICNNMILGISMIAISEAFNLAEKIGLHPDKLFEIVNLSSGQCWAMDHYPPVPNLLPDVPANHQFQPGFTSKMMYKDLALSQDAASASNISTPLGQRASELYHAFIAQGGSELDFSAIIQFLKQSPRQIS
jgi:3-hydroxyisobutyrate dehydrogenase